ncbi:MAG: hypothetical protein C0594_08390, partial [Marinilabiliales bacterium]
YSNVFDKKPKTVPVDKVVSVIKSDKLKSSIEQIRTSKDKKSIEQLKKKLPAVTVSGIFVNGHKSSDIQKHSGLIQIDIDKKDNPEINGISSSLKNDPYTCVQFASPSGGIKVFARIPENTKEHTILFTKLEAYYKNRYGISIDKKCKDIGRLCFLSYDPEIYYNNNASSFYPGKSVSQDVEKVLSIIEKNKIDITQDYQSWLKIGFAFSSEFGESGRLLFHRVSKFYTGYNIQDCNIQYDKCLNGNKEGASIKSFFQIAKDHKIDISPAENTNTDKSNENKDSIIGITVFHQAEAYLSKKYNFRRNIVANRIEYKEKDGNHFTELIIDNLFIELQKKGIKIALNNLESLFRSSYIKDFDPLIGYFTNLPAWDGVDHIANFASYVNAKDKERFVHHFKKWLARSVKTAIDPNFFNKQAFILVGVGEQNQNSGKTTWCRFLCPKPLKNYIKENLGTDKDSRINLAQNFIINLDELASLYAKEVNALKSYFSISQIKERLPYGKINVQFPRRCSFVGSTNNSEFLNDETGSVRWLTFEIESINWAYSKEIDIDKVYSQAVHLLNDPDFEYNLTIEEQKENDLINKKHQLLSEEHELIQKYFEPSEKGMPESKFMTATDIMKIIQDETGHTFKLSHVKVGKALKFLGFIQSQSYNDNGYQIKGYYIKPKTENSGKPF